MRKALVAFDRSQQSISWVEIDIDRDRQLIRKYDQKVPVLCAGDQELCHFFFDQAAVVVAISERA